MINCSGLLITSLVGNHSWAFQILRFEHDTPTFLCSDNKDSFIQCQKLFDKYLNSNLVKIDIETN